MRIIQRNYPKDHLVSPWCFHSEKSRGKDTLVIRRQIKKPDGKRTWERLPKKYYQHVITPEEANEFIIRLNGRDIQAEKAKAKWDIEHAYISTKLLKEFHSRLQVEMSDETTANTYYGYFRRYFLNFFMKLSPDPLEWHSKYSLHWKEALLNPDRLKLIKEKQRIFKKGTLKSSNTIKRIIVVSNSFMRFLHQELPAEVAELTFRPLKKSDYKNLRSKRELRGLVKGSKYILKQDLNLILENIPKEIESPTKLAQKFGLRESETLGLINKLGNIKKGYLFLQEQLTSYNKESGIVLGPLKGRKKVKAPYWYTTPQETYKLIERIYPMCSHTLSKKFSEYTMELFKKGIISQHYTFHDLRCTFITDATDQFPLKDVQFAVGHSSEKTTEGYKKDKRELDDEAWSPTGY